MPPIEFSGRVVQPDDQMHGLVAVAQVRYPRGMWHNNSNHAHQLLNSHLSRLPRSLSKNLNRKMLQIKACRSEHLSSDISMKNPHSN